MFISVLVIFILKNNSEFALYSDFLGLEVTDDSWADFSKMMCLFILTEFW